MTQVDQLLRVDGPGVAAVRPVSFWRHLLEEQWQARLLQVTELSLAFYDVGEHITLNAEGMAGRELRRLQRRTVAARRALADTEEALGRLSAGRYGRCEQCAEYIPVHWLKSRPDARYCARCSRRTAGRGRISPAPLARTATARSPRWPGQARADAHTTGNNRVPRGEVLAERRAAAGHLP
ncbi:MAG TPA: TraR/DksA C4-type zinc finger protein [Streptosporangiaceae bacterium]|nr:TraR/DksA C4-type zinc finger protein [Streptosporangiaceae bacterium]